MSNDEKKVVYRISPCPFCGGEPVLRRKSKTIIYGETKHTAYVECPNCHCRGTRCLLDDYNSPTAARIAAVRFWNSRVVPDATLFVAEDIDASEED